MPQIKQQLTKLCVDFTGNPLYKGDWIIRAEKLGRTQHLVYSKIVEEPQLQEKKLYFQPEWKFWIRTYHKYNKKFGGRGKAERTDCMVKIYEDEVPQEIVEAFNALT